MRVEAVELVRVKVPLVRPFRASYGVETHRDVLLVHVITDLGDGWGEDVAMTEPLYHPEFVEASHLALRDHLVPRLLRATDLRAADLARLFVSVRGWPMAKCALELAVLDAELRASATTLRDYFGATRRHIPVGVSVGLAPTVEVMLAEIDGYLAAGYGRIKLKIEPGNDIELVRAVRAHVGADVALQVDANGAYALSDADHLAELDEFDLLLVEEPLAEGDLRAHAALAQAMRTPICLDESITSLRVADEAITIGACSAVNIKPSRLGGYLEARLVHDLCVDRGVAAWCGGMLETGIGRAANLALAALPGFTLLPDLSASDRYFETDLTDPFVLRDGGLDVPTGAGIGVTPRSEVLRSLGATTERIESDRG